MKQSNFFKIIINILLILFTISCDRSSSLNNLKVISGSKIIDREDTRKKIDYEFNTEDSYKYIGMVSNGMDKCTGTLVGPRHVLTAAHCVYSFKNNSWLNNISYFVNFKADDKDKVAWKKIYINKEYAEFKNKRYDYALIELQDDFVSNSGWIELEVNEKLLDEDDIKTKVIGHPTDKTGNFLWESECTSFILSDRRNIEHYCDTFEGMSGGPLITIDDANNQYVFGIHTASEIDFDNNQGIFLDDKVLEQLNYWIEGDYDPTVTMLKDDNEKNFLVYIKNRCDEGVAVGIKFKDIENGWRTDGLFEILPRSETQIVTEADHLFYFASTFGADKQKRHRWSGEHLLHIEDTGNFKFILKNFKKGSFGVKTIYFECD